VRAFDAPQAGRTDDNRVRPADAAGFAARLEAALAPARLAGEVVSVETADYFRETARYGADAMDAVEAVFQSDSELACALLAEMGDGDVTAPLVGSFDALAAGLGLGREARHALSLRRRAANADQLPDARALAAEYRRRQAPLMALLADERRAPYAEHRARLAAIALPAGRAEAILPALLHLAAVRLAGVDPVEEARAYYFWERALEGLLRRA
jgi:thiopeptide-type bacteriocin biosynthesis protein